MYTGCNLKTTKLLDCSLTGACTVIRSNTVAPGKMHFQRKHIDMLSWYFCISVHKEDNFCDFLFAITHTKHGFLYKKG